MGMQNHGFTHVSQTKGGRLIFVPNTLDFGVWNLSRFCPENWYSPKYFSMNVSYSTFCTFIGIINCHVLEDNAIVLSLFLSPSFSLPLRKRRGEKKKQ